MGHNKNTILLPSRSTPNWFHVGRSVPLQYTAEERNLSACVWAT